MPIYEYQCSACHHTLETLQKMSDQPLTTCPACNAAALQKMVSSSSFQLKGNGWYATDYRTNNKPSVDPKPDPKKETPSTPATSGDGSAKT